MSADLEALVDRRGVLVNVVTFARLERGIID